MNIKDITGVLIIHYYLLSIQNTTQPFPRQIKQRPVSSVSAPGRWHNAIRVRAKPCVHRFNYSRTLPRREVPRQAVDIVIREYNDEDSSHLTYINKYFQQYEISTHCLGRFNFLHIRFCELQKASGITPWKNATRHCAGPVIGRMWLTDVYRSKQTGSSSTKGNHHPSFLRFSRELGRRKPSMQPKFYGAENVVKTETCAYLQMDCSVLLL